MANAPVPECNPRSHPVPTRRLWPGTAVSAALALVVTGLLCAPAATPGALSTSSAQAELGAGHAPPGRP